MNRNFNHAFKALLMIIGCVLLAPGLRAQLSGTKNIPADYASIAAFVTDLNTQGVGAGGVTLTVPSGYTETAPAGGFAITATGTLANPIIIQGTAGTTPVITASAALTAGALNDALFKIIGGDYITISGLELRENAANTTTTAASNNMTEWGIALLYATTTDGAQNVTLSGNTIVLNRTYQNTFGIYANSTHAAGSPTTSATATGTTGGTSGLKIYSNAITNVNQGIVVVGPTAAADHNDGIDIGGTSILTGNSISNYGTTGTFSSYANVSGSVYGIYVRNSKNFNISYNAVTSSVGGTTAGVLRGIFVQSFTNAPTGTFTNAINNNTLSVQSAATSSTVEAIGVQGTSSSATSVMTVSNNTIQNSGHTAAASGAINFINYVATHLTSTIANNNFNALSVNTTGTVALISHNFSIPAGGSMTISGNTIGTSFTNTAASGTVYGTFTNASSGNTGTMNYLNNTFSNMTVAGSTALTVFQNTDGGAGPIKVITGNTISNLTGVTGTITGMNFAYWSGSTSTLSNNTIHTLTGQGTVTGINIGSSANTANPAIVSNNTIYGLSSTGTGGAVTGIACANTSPSFIISGNTVRTLSSTGASLVAGISITGAAATTVSANRIYDLVSNNAGGTVFGIQITAGTAVSAFNNLISLLSAPIASGNDVIRGISISSGSASSAYGIYDNTIYLNATSTGTNFGSTGVFHTVSATATTAALDLRNNIIINESTPNGTGLTVAFRRSGTALNNYAATANRNLLYAGIPSATQLIMYDGTTSYQTMVSYQTAVTPRDLNSFTGEAFSYSTPGSFFISLTGSSADFLKPVAGITTQVESGGVNITTPSITTDFAGVIRAGNVGYTGTGTSPDVGAYEFEGTTPTPVITLNSVTPPAATECVASARLVSVNVTTSAGTIVSVNLGYTLNGVAQTPITMTNTTGTTWEGTIPVASPTNGLIAWGVSATNSLGINGGYTGTPYSDDPLFGTTASASSNPGVVCAGDPSTLTAALTKAGNVTIGSGSTASSNSAAVTPFYGGYGGVKTQYLIRASELTAAGLSAGNITSLSLTLTSAGSTLQGFAINAEQTALTALTTTIESVNNQVYSTASYVPAVGVNTFPFSTPLNWDGTSNIIISFCWSNANTSNTVSNVLIHSTAFVAGNARYVDSRTSAEVCGYTGSATPGGWNGSAVTVSSRPIFVIAGNAAPGIVTISWSDGVTTIGTTNPLSVSPTTTTTYTATMTASGCPVSTTPSTIVTVNPLPTAPTATNSAQCGVQVPTASVTSTTGASTPSFKWYDAASAGTLLQNSTSTTYTTAISSTTTFYVSEVDGTTGCESPRTAVTVTVSTPDPVSASASTSVICLGDAVTLTGANTAGTPLQTYSYSWSSTVNSGAETPVNGTSVSITPLAAGSYTYTVTAVDGGCTATNTVSVTVNPVPTSVVATSSAAAVCIGQSVDLDVTGNSNASVAFSYGEGFESWPPAGWTFINAGAGNAWAASTTAHSGSGSMYYAYNSAQPANAWGITSAQTLQAGTTYTISFWYKVQSASFPENLKVTVGNAATVVAQTTTLWDNNGGASLANTAWAQGTATFTPSSTGTYYFGFNCYSIADQWNLYVDDVSITGTENPLTYAWTSTPAGFTSSLKNPTGVAPSVTTTYSVTMTNQLGCSASASTAVTVNALPVVNAGTDQTACQGSPVTLAGSGATSYTWNNGVTDGVAFNTTATTTYTVTGTDGNGCQNTDQVVVNVNALPTVNAGTDAAVCTGAQATLTASGTATGYVWDNSVSDGVAFTPVATTTYTVTGTDGNGCQNTDQVVVTVNALPLVDAGADQAACIGSPVTLSGSGATSYSWDNSVTDGVAFNAAATTTYTVTGTDGNGCQNTDQIVVNVNVLPVVDAGADQLVCENGSVTLSGSGATTYSWDNGVTDGVAFTIASTTTYTVTGTDGNGCQNTDQVTVTTNAAPSVDAGADIAVCAGGNVTLTASGTATGYVWDNGITDGVAFTPTATTTFTLTGTDAIGCQATDQVTVTVNTLPIVDAGADMDACIGSDVTLSGSGATTYAWDNGVTDGVAFAAAATTTYSVTGTDANGCQNTDQITVTVNALPVVNAGSDQTVCEGTDVTLSGAGAATYAWDNGVTDGVAFAATTTTTYTVTGTDANGCQNTDQAVVNVNAAPNAVATDNGDATITASAGTSYQWVHCATGLPIAGATSQTYTATVNGNYAVVVTNASGCSDTSNCITIDNIGVEELADASIRVFPNPTNGDVFVTMSAENAAIEVLDAQGKLLQAITVANGEKVQLSAYETGVYFLRIRTENGQAIERIVKN